MAHIAIASHSIHIMSADSVPDGCFPQTKSTDLGCCCPHSPSQFIIIDEPKIWYSFYRPTRCRL